ncbi:MAG: pyridoxamine 5'-phosphate oxidase family protein [Treponema sp.]|jgi:nitroimidazol reductase NimA-like FMN-containing flavoprotein (pyridoxamine 5'-phosphate oxidase superfamily)|nr:pyridoxamine 5'-phosphate oxidase family protein [Treponema sp.]
MRRKDREITNLNEKLEIISKCKVCRLALAEDNVPYVVPLNFGYSFDNEILTLYFHGAKEGRKIDILRKNDQACFEMDCDTKLIEAKTASNYSYAFKSIIGSGKVYFIDDAQEKHRALNFLMKHQTGNDTEYCFSDSDLARTAVYKLVVDEFSGKKRE